MRVALADPLRRQEAFAPPSGAVGRAVVKRAAVTLPHKPVAVEAH